MMDNGTEAAAAAAAAAAVAYKLAMYNMWLTFLKYHYGMIGCIAVLAIFGNAMTLASLIKFPKLRRQKNALIGSLSMSDLCNGLCSLMWVVYSTSFETQTGWDATDVVVTLLVYISLFHLYAIGIDRFVAVVKPLHYPTLVTKHTTTVMIITSWLLPMVIIIPTYSWALRQTGVVYKVHRILSIVSFSTRMVVLSILYGKILSETRAQVRKIQAFTEQNSDGNTQKKSANHKGTRLVMIILSATAILGFPYCVSSILQAAEVEQNLYLLIFQFIAHECSLASSCINFFIYSAFTNDFRKAYKFFICCCKKKNIQNDEDGDSITYTSNV